MRENKKPMRVLVSGGGTGGHIFPAVSIANEIRRRHPEAEILFVGAEGRMEMERVPSAGYRIIGLPVAGFDRKRLWRNFKVVIKLIKSLRRARRVLREFRPDICVGVGGYASGPMLKAAQKRGIPTLIQEQNQYPGVTNKLLSKKARMICVAYDGMERWFPAETIVKTGNPVRSSILECGLTQAQAKEKLGFSAEKPLVLVIGGSLGARTVNEAVAHSLPEFEAKGVQVLWQTGKNYINNCEKQASGHPMVRATAFIDDMAAAYRAADVVVSRAGAGTISELQLLGVTAVLVPSPNVAEDHQRKNALALAEKGAAVMVLDADAVGSLGKEVLGLLADKKRCEAISSEIRKMALPDSASYIVDFIEEIVSERK